MTISFISLLPIVYSMILSRKCLLLIWMALVGFSKAQHDNTFCQLIVEDDSKDKFPSLPTEYSSIAEMRAGDSADLTYVRIKSNWRGGRLDFRSKTEHTVNILLKETDEVITVNMLRDTFDEDACQVDVARSPEMKANYDNFDHFLHLMDHMKKKYIGPTTTVRGGLHGDKLEACEYKTDSSPAYSIKVEWVIANNKSTVGETELISMPLQMKISTREYASPQVVDKVTFIEFFEFRSRLPGDEDIFLIPDRYYCADKRITQPLPKLSNFFSFKSEITLEGMKPNYLFEEYDYFMGLTRMDFYARYPYDKYKKYGKGLLTRIHDFNMNLEFIRDTRSGKCFYQAINETSVDTRRVNNTFIWRMRDPREFFLLEPNRTFQYSGQMKTRGQLAHVFVSQREVSVELEDNLKISVNGTYTWFFVENKNANPDAEEVDYIPIRMEYYSELESYDLNIYDFKTEEPTLMEFSVSDCFENLPQEQYVMEFNVEPTVVSRINLRRDLFMHWFEVAVAGSGKLSFLRIRVDKITVTLTPASTVSVRFTLFEKPSLVASTEAGLEDAVKALLDSVDSEKFALFLPNARNNLEYVPVPRGALKKYTNSIIVNDKVQSFGFVSQPGVQGGKETPRKQAAGGGGISTGMFAFLMIATLMVGSVLGCGILYFVYRKNGRLPGGDRASGMNYVNIKEDN